MVVFMNIMGLIYASCFFLTTTKVIASDLENIGLTRKKKKKKYNFIEDTTSAIFCSANSPRALTIIDMHKL